MSAPDLPGDSSASADDLLRCLGAFGRALERWLADLDSTCPENEAGQPAFALVFRRWLEQLAEIRLHLHRCEHRLHHVCAAGHGEEAALPRVNSGPDRRARLERWLDDLHLQTAYVRIVRILELNDEPLPADIVTDLAGLAHLAEQTLPILSQIAHERPFTRLQDAAYFGVLAPWRRRGLPALDATSRWLVESLDDAADW